MIREIKIHKIASYADPVVIHPLKINFCYGSNGSGKTTLSNFLGGYKSSEDSAIAWRDERELPVVVYNKCFVENNFAAREPIRGIFTLGQDSKEAQEYIDKMQAKVNFCQTLIDSYYKSLIGLNSEINDLNDEFTDTCWAVQQIYGPKFREALTGFRASKALFRDNCLKEFSKLDAENITDFTVIEDIYNAAYGTIAQEYPLFKPIDIQEVIECEACSLLDKRISGSSETPIGKFIEYLNASDWVKQGIGFAREAKGKCPYCQQQLPIDVQKDIEGYFDETYNKECETVRNFQIRYVTVCNELLERMRDISHTSISFLEYTLFKAEIEVLAAVIETNKKTIERKMESPSTLVNIESIKPIAQRINTKIDEFNAAIRRNNEIVQNKAAEKMRCKELLWQHMVYELRSSIQHYNDRLKGKKDGIVRLNNKIDEQKALKKTLNLMIEEKEATMTSVAPTVNAINSILDRFGFKGFQLAENTEARGTYKIIRTDGSDAQKSLSEGEYNFITFLYFYHLVYGSQDSTGIATDKVVVVDDPISSLDSNVLFIISTLVRNILNDCKAEKNGIQQIFVLTHNVYFHKEVSFLGSRKEYPSTMAAFWIVKKNNNVTEFVKHAKNPIQTAYELMWSELKDGSAHQRVTIFNTLRRILEYYFNVIGGMNYEKCIDEFDGEDKIICKALISCINDGSHFISDDYVQCFETDSLENYFRVFKLIFEKMGHGSHYEMMMNR